MQKALELGEAPASSLGRLLNALDDLDSLLVDRPDSIRNLPRQKLRSLLARVEGTRLRLEQFARAIDPVLHHDVYDPSHPEAAADLIARKLLEQDRVRLDSLAPFWGAGVYALYYTGQHPAYQLISNREIPIYVGKADPRVPHALTSKEQGQSLYSRLGEHLKSIRAAEAYADANNDIGGLAPIRASEFECRYLVLASAYSGAVEAVLIRHWQPVWNKEVRVCIGFGKHGDAAETRANTRSDWDTLHPGRTWATREGNLPNKRSPGAIQADIIAHLEGYPPREVIP